MFVISMANEDHDDQIKGTTNTTTAEKEGTSANSSIFSDQIPTAFPSPFSSIFHTPCASIRESEIKTSNLGFIHNILGIQDYMISTSNSLFNMFQTPSPPPPPPPPPQPQELASPSGNNSTNSISSISSIEMTINDAQSKTTGEEQDQDQDHEETKSTMNRHELKPKKKNAKRQRQPRFAFMTKSDVDHLDDGYRWRKYGQKAVKNSPYPRSYYRCTMASCGVKKRVERSSEDSTVVVTTYEGNHGHPCPVTLRGTTTATTTTTTTSVVSEAACFLGGGVNFRAASTNFTNVSQTHNYNDDVINNPPSSSIISPPQPFSSTYNPLLSEFVPRRDDGVIKRRHDHEYYNYNNCTPFSTSASSSSMIRDHGLLQDMIMPSQARKDAEEDDHHLDRQH